MSFEKRLFGCKNVKLSVGGISEAARGGRKDSRPIEYSESAPVSLYWICPARLRYIA